MSTTVQKSCTVLNLLLRQTVKLFQMYRHEATDLLNRDLVLAKQDMFLRLNKIGGPVIVLLFRSVNFKRIFWHKMEEIDFIFPFGQSSECQRCPFVGEPATFRVLRVI